MCTGKMIEEPSIGFTVSTAGGVGQNGPQVAATPAAQVVVAMTAALNFARIDHAH
jgi:hypothetical protein